MKNLLYIICLVFFVNISYSQIENVNKATEYVKLGELDKAFKLIEKACLNPESNKKAITWKLSGDIYFEILKSGNEEYIKLSNDPLKSCFESYKKAKELDSTNNLSKDINSNLQLLQSNSLNIGTNMFYNRKFDMAFNSFSFAYEVAENLNYKDSIAAFNCALSLENLGKIEDAISWYEKCIEINFKTEMCCFAIIDILKSNNQEEKMLEYLKKFRKAYPKDQSLVITELNYFIEKGNWKKAIDNLNEALVNDQKNEILYFSLGTIKDASGDRENAEKHYLHAIKLNPEYYDAVYNLGALYYNHGVKLHNQAENENDNIKHDNLKNKANESFKKAITHLEKAYKLDPNDNSCLVSLKSIYSLLNRIEDYNRIKSLLNN